MTTDPNRITIIGTLDRTSPADEWVIRTASALASTLPHAELHFLHVVHAPKPIVDGASVLKERLQDARAFVDRVVTDAAASFQGKVSGHIAVGSAHHQILQLASDLEADLIVVGSHKKSAAGRWLLGSVSQSIVSDAPCAVLVARPKESALVPSIAPPCPDCLEVQRTTRGEKLWCARHATRHVQGQLHYAEDAGPSSLGGSSMFIRT